MQTLIRIRPDENRDRFEMQPRQTTLLVTVWRPEEIPATIMSYASIEGFTVRSTHHYCVVGYATSRHLRDAFRAIGGNRENHLHSLREAALDFDWSYTLQPHYTELHRVYPDDPEDKRPDERWSITQMLQIPSIVPFYQQLSAMFQVELPLPPTHLTLWTRGTHPDKSLKGIGLRSDAEFAELRQQEWKF